MLYKTNITTDSALRVYYLNNNFILYSMQVGLSGYRPFGHPNETFLRVWEGRSGMDWITMAALKLNKLKVFVFTCLVYTVGSKSPEAELEAWARQSGADISKVGIAPDPRTPRKSSVLALRNAVEAGELLIKIPFRLEKGALVVLMR